MGIFYTGCAPHVDLKKDIDFNPMIKILTESISHEFKSQVIILGGGGVYIFTGNLDLGSKNDSPIFC